MKHSDGLPEKAKRSSKLVVQISTKNLTNTKLQNAKHRITSNRQIERRLELGLVLSYS